MTNEVLVLAHTSTIARSPALTPSRTAPQPRFELPYDLVVDGRALAAPMLPSAVALAPDGSLLVAQIEPVPAIRRVNLATGTISTLARG